MHPPCVAPWAPDFHTQLAVPQHSLPLPLVADPWLRVPALSHCHRQLHSQPDAAFARGSPVPSTGPNLSFLSLLSCTPIPLLFSFCRHRPAQFTVSSSARATSYSRLFPGWYVSLINKAELIHLRTAVDGASSLLLKTLSCDC